MNSEISIIIDLLKKLDQRLELVENHIKSTSAQERIEESNDELSSNNELVTEFQLLIDSHINPLVEYSKRIAQPEIINQIDQLVNAINEEKKLIEIATKHIKPSKETLLELVKTINGYAVRVCQIRDGANRKSKEFNNLSVISESIGFLSWVIIDKLPRAYVEEMRHSAEFYTNKILTEYRNSNKDQVDWVNSYLNFLIDLETYIKKYHITGLYWNSKGLEYKSSQQIQQSQSSQQQQPKEQKLNELLSTKTNTQLQNESDKSKLSAIFNEISKGENITKGLKKVTKEMKTNNNSSDKSSIVKGCSKDIKPISLTTPVYKSPKISIDFDKWVIEHQVNNKNIKISVQEKRQSVYIYKCNNSIVQINGKFNQIIINDCIKTSVVFENVISSCQIVNCTSSEIQVTGFVPSISIDKTNGCQIYLSKDSLETEIITSKSSEMNILIPNKLEDGDLIEIPIVDQFKSLIKNNKLITEPITHI